MTFFIRVLESQDKETMLLQGIKDKTTQSRFNIDPETFSKVPGSPFAYWVSEPIRSIFKRLPTFEDDTRTAKVGLQTNDDFQWIRNWWESSTSSQNLIRVPCFAKGGEFSPFYSDLNLVIRWGENGKLIKTWKAEQLRKGNITANNSKCWNEDFYFKPGITWTNATTAPFSARILMKNCIFAHRGPAAFTEKEINILAYLAIFNSAVFRYLGSLSLGLAGEGRKSYEVGLIQRTPVPEMNDSVIHQLAELARRAWSLKRSLDTVVETSHAFELPLIILTKKMNHDPVAINQEISIIQEEIDNVVSKLYEINEEDSTSINRWARGIALTKEGLSNDDDVNEKDEIVSNNHQNNLLSWCVGVAFRRFDIRLATGDRIIPPEPDPFDSLPMRSPGMIPEPNEIQSEVVILVDDLGHVDDLSTRVLDVLNRVKSFNNVEISSDFCRNWLAEQFFALHIKMYTKSRRKAPIYWQLATASASYSVWLYIHAFTKDTLYKVQNDYVAPKLLMEERNLKSIREQFGPVPKANERKQLVAQEVLVEELRTFLAEVRLVAPLWNPELDDGVIINFAPLWRLVPQHKAWQKELKATWDALCRGDYDWTHWAMHLWPERVVPKCASDRSLAITHGLEDVFWVEGTDGKWNPRKKPIQSVNDLIRTRTSPAVKEALKNILEAPAKSENRTRRTHGRGGRE